MIQNTMIIPETAIFAQQLGKRYDMTRRPFYGLKRMLRRRKETGNDTVWALKGASFQIARGETVGIIGANGAGKTTLLQLVSGISNPSVGTIKVCGRVAALLELGAGFNPEFSGRDNIFLNASILGLDRYETNRRMDDIIGFSEIGDYIDQPVKTYSSGMFVRLAFAIAVNVSPEILIIDEALSVGDIRFQQKCSTRIKEISRNKTVLLVSHDLRAINELCDRVIWLDKGEISAIGDPAVVTEKFIQALYASDPETDRMEQGAAISKLTGAQDGFTPIASDARQYGNEMATIEAIRMELLGGAVFSGKPVDISIICRSKSVVTNVIVGFSIRNDEGKEIFDDRFPADDMRPGGRYHFRMHIPCWPDLGQGVYSLSVGVASGTLEEHVYCHAVFETINFESIPEWQPPFGYFAVQGISVEYWGP